MSGCLTQAEVPMKVTKPSKEEGEWQVLFPGRTTGFLFTVAMLLCLILMVLIWNTVYLPSIMGEENKSCDLLVEKKAVNFVEQNPKLIERSQKIDQEKAEKLIKIVKQPENFPKDIKENVAESLTSTKETFQKRNEALAVSQKQKKYQKPLHTMPFHEKSSENDTNQANEGFIVGIKLLRRMIPSTRRLERNFQDAKYANNAGDVSKSAYEPKSLNLDKSQEQMQKFSIRVKTEVIDKSTIEKTHGIPTVVNRSIMPSMDVTHPKSAEHLRVKRLAGLLSQIKKLSADKKTNTDGTVTKNLSGTIHLQHQGSHGLGEGLRLGTSKGMEAVASIANDKKEFMHNIQHAMIQKNEGINGQHRIRPTESSSSRTGQTSAKNKVKSNLSGNIHLQHRGSHGLGEGLRSETLKGMEAMALIANNKKEFMHNIQQAMIQKNRGINRQHGIRPTESSSSRTGQTSANNKVKLNLSGNIQLQQQGKHELGKDLTLETLKGMEAVASIANDKKEFMHNIQQAMIQKNEEINGQHRIRPTESSRQTNQTSVNNKVKSNLFGSIQFQQQGSQELGKSLTLEVSKGTETAASTVYIHPQYEEGFTQNTQQVMVQKNIETNGQHEIKPMGSQLGHTNQTPIDKEMETIETVKANLSGNVQIENQGNHKLGESLLLQASQATVTVASTTHANPQHKEELMHDTQETIQNMEINRQRGIRPVKGLLSHTNQTSVDKEMDAKGTVEVNLSGNIRLQHQGTHQLGKSPILEASQGTEAAKIPQEIADMSSKIPHGISDLLFSKTQQSNNEGSVSNDPQLKTDHEQYFITSPYPNLYFNNQKKISEQLPTNFQKQIENSKSNEQDNIFSPALLEGTTKIQLFQTDVSEDDLRIQKDTTAIDGIQVLANQNVRAEPISEKTSNTAQNIFDNNRFTTIHNQSHHKTEIFSHTLPQEMNVSYILHHTTPQPSDQHPRKIAEDTSHIPLAVNQQPHQEIKDLSYISQPSDHQPQIKVEDVRQLPQASVELSHSETEDSSYRGPQTNDQDLNISHDSKILEPFVTNNQESRNTGTEFVANFKDKPTESSVIGKVSEDSGAKLIINKPCSGDVATELIVAKENQGNADIAIVNEQIHENAGNTFTVNKEESILVTNQEASGNIVTKGDISKLDSGDRAIKLDMTEKVPESLEAKLAISKTFSGSVGAEITANKHEQNTNFLKPSLPTMLQTPGHLSSDSQTLTLSTEIIIPNTNTESIDLNHSPSYKPQVNVRDPNLQIGQSDEFTANKAESKSAETKFITNKLETENPRPEFVTSKYSANKATESDIIKKILDTSETEVVTNKINFENMATESGITEKVPDNSGTGVVTSKIDLENIATELNVVGKPLESLESKTAIKPFSGSAETEFIISENQKNTNIHEHPAHIHLDSHTLALLKKVVTSDNIRKFPNFDHFVHKPHENTTDSKIQTGQLHGLVTNKAGSKSTESITNKQETGNQRTEFVTSKYSADKSIQLGITDKVPDNSRIGVVTSKHDFENTATELNVAGKPSESLESKIVIDEPFSGSEEAEFITNENQQNTNIFHFSTQTVSQGTTKNVLDNSGSRVVTSKHDFENIVTESDVAEKRLESSESKIVINEPFSRSEEAEFITNENQQKTNILHLNTPTAPQGTAKDVLDNSGSRVVTSKHDFENIATESDVAEKPLESSDAIIAINEPFSGSAEAEFITNENQQKTNIIHLSTPTVPAKNVLDNSGSRVVTSKHDFENIATELDVAEKPLERSDSIIAINEPFPGSAEAEFISNENQQKTNILHLSTPTAPAKNVPDNSGSRVVTSKHDFENIVTESDVAEKPLESSDSIIAINEPFLGSTEAEFIIKENQQNTNILHLSTPTAPQGTSKDVLDNSGSRVVISKHVFENVATESGIAEKPMESSESKIDINKPLSGSVEAEFIINKNQQNTNVGDSSTSTAEQNSGHTNLDTHTLPLLKEMVISDTAKSDLNNFSHDRPQENVPDSDIESGKHDQLAENKAESKSMESEFITKQTPENPGTEFVTSKLYAASDLGVSRLVLEGSEAKLAINKTFSGNLGAEFIANKGIQGNIDILPANKEIYGNAGITFTTNKAEPILVANKQVSGSIAAQVVINKHEPGDTAMGLDPAGKASKNLGANVAIKKNFSGNFGAELITNVEKVGNVEDKFVVGKPEHGSVGAGFMVGKQVSLNTGTGLNINKQEHINMQAEFTNKQEPGNGGSGFTITQKPGNAQSGSVATVLNVENTAGPENTGTLSKNFNQQGEFGIEKKITFNLEKEQGSQLMALTNVGDRVKNYGPNIVMKITGTASQGTAKDVLDNSGSRVVISKHDFENIATESDIAEKHLETPESKIVINKPFSGSAEAEFISNENQQKTNILHLSTPTAPQGTAKNVLDNSGSRVVTSKHDFENIATESDIAEKHLETPESKIVINKPFSGSAEAEFITNENQQNTNILHLSTPTAPQGTAKDVLDNSGSRVVTSKHDFENIATESGIAEKPMESSQSKIDINKSVSGSIAAQVVINKHEPGDTAMGLGTTGKASENLGANVAIKKNFSGNFGAVLITNVEKVGNVEDKFVVGKPEHGSVGAGFMVDKQVSLNTGTGLNINKQERINMQAEFTNKQEPGNGGSGFTITQKPGNAQSGSEANVLKVENITGPENTGTLSKNFNQQGEFGIEKKITFNLEKEQGSQRMALTNVGDRVKNYGPNIVTKITGTSGNDKEKITNSDKRLHQNHMTGRASASSHKHSDSGIAFRGALSGSIQIPGKGSNARHTEHVQRSRNTKTASINFDVSIDKRNLSGNGQQAPNNRGKISDASKGFLTGTLNSKRQESGNERSSSGSRTGGFGHRSAITLNSQKTVGGRISSAGIQFG